MRIAMNQMLFTAMYDSVDPDAWAETKKAVRASDVASWLGGSSWKSKYSKLIPMSTFFRPRRDIVQTWCLGSQNQTDIPNVSHGEAKHRHHNRECDVGVDNDGQGTAVGRGVAQHKRGNEAWNNITICPLYFLLDLQYVRCTYFWICLMYLCLL